ncbi:hypothetical protein CRYUN_Cryun05aG0068500 [Craigia yunnanensis]
MEDKGISSRLTRQKWAVPATSPAKWSYYTLKEAAMKSEMAKHDQISWWFPAFLRRKANKLTAIKVWLEFLTADQGRGSRSKRRSDDDFASESESDENDSRDSSPGRSSRKRSKDQSRCSKCKSSRYNRSRSRRDRDSDDDSFSDDSEGSDRGRSKKKRSSRNITEEEIAEYMAKKAQKKAKPDAGKLIVGIIALLVASASGLLIWDDHPTIMAVGVEDGTSEAVFQTLMSLGPSRSEICVDACIPLWCCRVQTDFWVHTSFRVRTRS